MPKKDKDSRPSGNVKRHRKKTVKGETVSDGWTWFKEGWVMPSHRGR